MGRKQQSVQCINTKNYVIPHVEEWFAYFLNYCISLEGFPKSATDFQPHDILDI